jgi:hypothetical protein
MRRERRRFKRIPIEHLVAFSCYNSGEKMPFDHSMGKALNVGEGGLMLLVYKPVALGTVLDIEIGIGDEIVGAKVEVLNTRKVSPEGDSYTASTRFVYIDHRTYLKMMRLEGLPALKKAGNFN